MAAPTTSRSRSSSFAADSPWLGASVVALDEITDFELISHTGDPATRGSLVLVRPPDEPAPLSSAKERYATAAYTAEDIQAYVKKGIKGELGYAINEPPTGRPVRIYTAGAFDLFHAGHALLLRQAKLSFPNVQLLVGVFSNEVLASKEVPAQLDDVERCETLRHCRWVDEVIPNAPWIIDTAFLAKWQIDYIAGEESSADAKRSGKFIPTRPTAGISTDILIERVGSAYATQKFDELLNRPVSPPRPGVIEDSPTPEPKDVYGLGI